MPCPLRVVLASVSAVVALAVLYSDYSKQQKQQQQVGSVWRWRAACLPSGASCLQAESL